MPRGKKANANRVLVALDTHRVANAAKKELLAAVQSGNLTDEENDYFDLMKEVFSEPQNGQPRKDQMPMGKNFHCTQQVQED